MKRSYKIQPEVAGNIANSAFIDRTARPPLIKTLVYEFDGWLGDDIVCSILTYIVTERLKLAIEEEQLTGINFDDVTVLASEKFRITSNAVQLPVFIWLKISSK